jgi:hypothetical protein
MPERVFRPPSKEKPEDFLARVRKQTIDDYTRDEMRRVDADRYIETISAIRRLVATSRMNGAGHSWAHSLARLS